MLPININHAKKINSFLIPKLSCFVLYFNLNNKKIPNIKHIIPYNNNHKSYIINDKLPNIINPTIDHINPIIQQTINKYLSFDKYFECFINQLLLLLLCKSDDFIESIDIKFNPIRHALCLLNIEI